LLTVVNRKKLSGHGHSSDWSRQSRNYVAKSYMEDVARDVYFDDVRLQMDAKLWGEEYNRHNPPKKVCSDHVMNLIRHVCIVRELRHIFYFFAMRDSMTILQ